MADALHKLHRWRKLATAQAVRGLGLAMEAATQAEANARSHREALQCEARADATSFAAWLPIGLAQTHAAEARHRDCAAATDQARAALAASRTAEQATAALAAEAARRAGRRVARRQQIALEEAWRPQQRSP